MSRAELGEHDDSPFDRECFFIAPIGEEGSEVRRRSDGVLNFVVRPAAESLGLSAVRADDVSEPGIITSQVVEHVWSANAAVADLTGGNPNVYYELAIRHAAHKPVVLIAESGTQLPFDVAQARAIFFDSTDLTESGQARDKLIEQLAASLSGRVDSPVAAGMRLQQLSEGNVAEQTLARMLDLLERLASSYGRLEGRMALLEVRRARRRAPADTSAQSTTGLGGLNLSDKELAALRKALGSTGGLTEEQREQVRHALSHMQPVDLPDLTQWFISAREAMEAGRAGEESGEGNGGEADEGGGEEDGASNG